VTIQATPAVIKATVLAMGRAAIYDDFFTHPDKARVAAWAEAIQRYELDAPELLDAVTTFYGATPQGRLTVGELIRVARASRQDATMRQESNERAARGITSGLTPRAAITAGDQQLGGLPIAGANGEPVWAAYEVSGAIERECEACGAPPEKSCLNIATGTARKIPCLARMRPSRR
jgi:hypothetical protein